MSLTGWWPRTPLLAMTAGWVALFAWNGMVAQPGGVLISTLVVALVMVLVGSWLRLLAPPLVVAAVQLAIAIVLLNLLFAARESLLAVVPTPESLRHLIHVIGSGAATLDRYSAPVEVNPTETRAMLVACALALLLAIDVLVMGLGRPALLALPLLVILSVPVSILQAGLALPVLVGTALLFLRLLATEHLDVFGAWATGRWGRALRSGGSSTARPGLTTLWQVSVAAVLVAILAAPLVPVTDLLHRSQGRGDRVGSGNGSEAAASNPFIRLRRDLVAQTHTPLVYAETQSRSTGYLRTTVLDEFTDTDWRPSSRILPEQNDAEGVFPSPPGLAPGVGGPEDTWTLELAPESSTTWLPLPYPIRKLRVPGSWRYDSRTLDVAFVGGATVSPLRYHVTAFDPSVTAALLSSTRAKAPDDVRIPMTRLPKSLPKVIRTRAEQVTRDAKGDFAKAVALQDWFRNSGGFRYSLNQRSGSGMALLAAFVTNDRVGYCEQFAAAMAAMGRTLGIPSRVVVGFLDGRTQPDGRIVYTSDDRHAWPEMYLSGAGWVRFEPTPSQRAGATPPYTRQDTQAARPSSAPSAAASRPSAPTRAAAPTETSVARTHDPVVTWWPVLALLVVVLLGLVPGLVRHVQRRRRLSPRHPVHLAEGAWAELGATALDLGLDWPERRSPREQAQRVAGQVKAEDGDLRSLEGLLTRVEQGRYARTGPVETPRTEDGEVRRRTVETVTAWRKVMVGSVDRERGWRGRVWPVSVVRGVRRGSAAGQERVRQ